MHGAAHPALQRASPDRRRISAAALVVALEPLAHFAELHQVGRAADAAAEIGEIEVLRPLLFGDGIVQLPEIDNALVELVPVINRAGRRQAPTLFAMTDRKRPQRRPGVGEHTVHVVKRVDLAHDRGHVIGHVSGEHAGAEQPGILAVVHHIALRVALEPLGVGLDGVFPIEIRTHARDDVQATLFGGRATVAEEVPVAQKLAFPVVGDFGLIKRQNAGDTHQHGVHLQAGPVIRPLLHVEHHGVVFGHVGLAKPADFPLPRDGRIRGEQGSRQSGGWHCDKFTSIQVHVCAFRSRPAWFFTVFHFVLPRTRGYQNEAAAGIRRRYSRELRVRKYCS